MSKIKQDVLTEAYQALRQAVAGVPADGWRLPTPCKGWDVTQVLQHAVGDQLAYAGKLTDGPGPGYDPFQPTGELGGKPEELLESALTTATAAFATVDPAAQQVPVPLPPFALSPEQAAGAAALDAAVHAWDIARATGRPSPLTPELARALRPIAEALAEPLRGFAYAPAIPSAEDADELVSLLNYLGRQADWSE